MEVRKGFKQTELGIFPVEWKELKIKDISEISVGKDLVESEFSSYQDDTYKYPVFSNTVSNEGLYGFYNYSEYTKESLTVVGRGVGLGTAFKREESFGAIGRLLVLKPFQEYDFRYLTYFINFRVNIHFESGGIPQLTGVSFGNYKVILPSTKSEQTAIATALSDVDALITSLEKLIEKKRVIKQGAMQELLRPKEGWETDKAKNLALITTGSKNTQDKVNDGNYPFFVRSQTVERINSYSFEGEAILTAGDGVGTGKVFHYINGRFDFHQRVYKISDFIESIDGKFFYLYFTANFYNRIMQMTAKSSVDSVRMEMIGEMEIPYPTKSEQTRIATILSDMDAEITTLEQKLAKYKQIKQGMMQELLTGRIRLVENV